MTDTFSANSLKILNDSYELFLEKFVNSLDFKEKNEESELGNRLHGLICYLLKGYPIEKIEKDLDENEFALFEKIKKSEIINFVLNSEKKFIEQPFFIKENVGEKIFYLTGRFDCVVKNGEKYTILDWKTNLLPKNPESDIQTVVYFEGACKLFKTQNIEMIYISLKSLISQKVEFKGGYLDIIQKIVSKYIK